MAKIRIDEYLLKNNYFTQLDDLKRHIMAGKVLINQQIITSGATKYNVEDIKDVVIKKKDNKYSSRAGYKLEKAITYWELDFKDKIVLDVGASTGGFVSCALAFGAHKVYALDVGTNQLDYNLRVNPNVKVFEQTNFRTIDKKFFNQKFDIITMDVSFISIKLLLSNVKKFLKDDGIFICLIKPQFEADKDVHRNKGIIVDEKVHKQVIENIKENVTNHNMKFEDVIESPIQGAKGNKEFLALIKNKKGE